MTKSNNERQFIITFGVLVLITLGAISITGIPLLPVFVKYGAVDCTLIILAAIKITLVTEYFMELHDAPNWLRGIMMTWIVTTTVVLVSIVGLNSQIY